MTEFVEIPNPALGSWAPCPYARQARIANKIEIIFWDNITDTITPIHKSIDSIVMGKEVAVVCFDHTQISPDDLIKFVNDTNKSIMPEYVILEDHPGIEEYINGVKMNFNYCGLLVIQQLNKLNEAATQLHNKDYYKVWSADNINDIVAWRTQ